LNTPNHPPRYATEQKRVPCVFPGGKGGRCVRLTTLPPSCAVVMRSGNLDFLEPSGSLQACNGTALPFTLYIGCCDWLMLEQKENLPSTEFMGTTLWVIGFPFSVGWEDYPVFHRFNLDLSPDLSSEYQNHATDHCI